MRVSKVVREYIEESVRKAVTVHDAADRYNELLHRYQAARDEVNEAVTILVNNMIPLMMEKYQLEAEYPLIPKTGYNNVDFGLWKHPLNDAKMKEENENRKRREESIKEIILTLELGGTKADLDRMIAELSRK